MRIVLFAVLGLFASGFHAQSTKHKLLIDTESKLVINGKTNVNSFACKTQRYSRKDTIEFEQNGGSDVLMIRNRMVLPVDEFDCGIQAITHDFLEALNSDEYPHMEIRFLSLNGLQKKEATTIKGKVKILLSGAEKTYDVDFNVKENGNGIVALTGRKAALFRDFGLTPPRKMMGMIQVKEDLDVEFLIQLRQLN